MKPKQEYIYMDILHGSIGFSVIGVIKDIDQDNGILSCPVKIMFSLFPSSGLLCFKQALVKVQERCKMTVLRTLIKKC